MTRRIEFTVPDEIGKQYDQARGDVPMAAWLKRAAEEKLERNGWEPSITSGPIPTPRTSVRSPKRASSAKHGVKPRPKAAKR